jgi:hypothetical protein
LNGISAVMFFRSGSDSSGNVSASNRRHLPESYWRLSHHPLGMDQVGFRLLGVAIWIQK